MIDLKENDLINIILDLVDELSTICYNITKGLGLKIEEFLNMDKLGKLKFTPDMISLRSNLVNIKFINKCHSKNIKSLAWDFFSYNNPTVIIKSIINMGIDGILFDDYKNIAIIKSWLEKI